MKAQTFASLVALASGIQLVAGGFTDASAYECPSKATDTCGPTQTTGFNWGSLPTGSFSSYGGFGFSGFSCADSFSKRDGGLSYAGLAERDSGFQSKCISGSACTDSSKSPTFFCGSSDAFSVDTIQITVEFDCDVEFWYGMKDGSTCKQTQSCSTSGTTVKNTQCGGAKDCTVVLPSSAPTPTCSIGIHSIGFYCPTGSSSTILVTPTTTSTKKSSSSTTTSAAVATTTTTTTTSIISSTTTSTTSTAAVVSSTTTSSTSTTTSSSTTTCTTTTTAAAESSTTTTSAAAASTTTTTTTTVAAVSSSAAASSTTEATPTTTPVVASSSAAATTTTTSAITSSLAAISSTSAAETITTVVVETTTTFCPVTNTYVSSGSTSIETTLSASTIFLTTTKTVCPICEQTSTAAPAATSTPATSCPEVLPSCLNTWLPANCADNTDVACFCPSSNFTSLVFDCLSAHGASSSEIASAAAYYQGICAPYVPQNPAIITACPTGATTVPAGLLTTITLATTLTVPCTSGPASFTTTALSTAATVPQVVFSTITGSAVSLVPGTAAPAATPASTTFAPAAVSTLATTTPAGNSTATSTSAAQFTGAASKASVGAGMFGAVMALAVLVL